MNENCGLDRHPMGIQHTKKLIQMAQLSPCRILDMGAGKGETVAYLKEQGYDAVGIDINAGDGILCADYLHSPFEDESFDAVISECSFFISGDEDRAFSEAYRVLRHGGVMLYGDVCVDEPTVKFRKLTDAGFEIEKTEDITDEWKSFYIQLIWQGDTSIRDCMKERKKCRYYLTICKKK